MPNLEDFKVIGREEEPTPTPELTPDPIPEPSPDPILTPEPAPTPDPTPEPVNDFPVDRFGGKFKSWDELNEFVNKEPEKPKFDPYLQQIIDKWQADGDLSDYFKANAIDYDKVSDEELIKRDFFAKYPDLSEKATNKLWEKELAKYKLDPEEHDEEDLEIANALMKREANRLRESGKEAQKQFLQPQRQVAQPPSVEELAKTVHAMPEAQGMKAKKSISFTSGDTVINYGVDDVDSALDLAANEDGFAELLLKDGRLNVEKWVKAVEFIKNEEKIVKTLIDQGIAMGQKMIDKEIKNPSFQAQQPDKFNGSTTKERFISTLAQQQGIEQN